MSGRKGWEVANVLSETEEVQKKIFNSYKDEINKDISKIEKINKNIQENKNIISNYNPDTTLIQEELKDEMKNLTLNMTNLKKSIVKLTTMDIDELKNELTKIDTEIETLNKQAEKLREKIKQKSGHYMNEEYSKATKIKNRITQLKELYQKLKHNITSKKHTAKQVEEESISKINIKNDMDKEIDRLNKQAGKIQKIRNEANSLKQEILNIINSIDTEKANKFVTNEYKKILDKVEKFTSLSDKDVINGFSNISVEITKLKNSYEEKYNEWLSQKRYSESLLSDIKGLGEKEEVSLVESILDGSNQLISKFAYYEHYKKDNSKTQFDTFIKTAQKNIDNENFQEANNILNEAKKLYETISDKTDTLRENIEASINLAFKIRKIMLNDLGFNRANLETIDDNFVNGFRLECQNGDTINFEEIRFDEDGKLIVNLDHIENTNGTCGVRWEDMQKVFNKKGIPLTDVTKNGKSVILRDKRADTTSTKKQQRER